MTVVAGFLMAAALLTIFALGFGGGFVTGLHVRGWPYEDDVDAEG